MSSFVHGIATVQMIDSSGEIVDIKGHDISSLDKTGVINYEHKADLPAQVVAKILRAKKLYKASDCANEHERYFWNKVETPCVYVVAEMFDDYCDSAREAAGQLRYSADRPHQQGILGFSVEGSSIPGSKEGVTIKRSIARKVSLTATPCNKSCFAELMPVEQPSQVKDDFDFIFKTEQNTIDMFKSGKAIEIYQDFLAHKDEALQKSRTLSGGTPKPPAAGSPNAFGSRTSDAGWHLGNTQSGKPVFSHTHVHAYDGFTSQDHRDAAGLHAHAAETTVGDAKLGDKHMEKMKLHNAAASTAEKRENRYARGLQGKRAAAKAFAQKTKIAKALTAGGGGGAPSTLVNGGAFQKESLKSSEPKKKWSERAKDEYESWAKREEFENFMKSHAPNLTHGEIRAIGQVLALKKNLDAEAALSKVMPMDKALTFGSKEDQAAATAAMEDRKKNPEKYKPAPQPKKAPELKGPIESEVHEIKTSIGHTPTGTHELDTVTLKSGHESGGHPQGKFKVGDKVTMRPHLMGTHILEHKKD